MRRFSPVLVLCVVLGSGAAWVGKGGDAQARDPDAQDTARPAEEALPLDPAALAGLTPEMSLPPGGAVVGGAVVGGVAAGGAAAGGLAPGAAPPQDLPAVPVITSSGGRAAAALDEGYRALRVGAYAEALRAYSRAVRLEPSGDAHLGRGAALEGLGRLTDAVAAYDRAAQARPGDPLVRARLVQALGRLAPEEALDRLGALATAWPEDPAVVEQIGFLQARAGQPLAALGALTQAALLDRTNPVRQLNAAIAADQAGEAARAVVAYRHALGVLRAQGNPPGIDLAALARRAHWLENRPRVVPAAPLTPVPGPDPAGPDPGPDPGPAIPLQSPVPHPSP